jgi:hypothetical protein
MLSGAKHLLTLPIHAERAMLRCHLILRALRMSPKFMNDRVEIKDIFYSGLSHAAPRTPEESPNFAFTKRVVISLDIAYFGSNFGTLV